jgi:hypothetical protein
MDRITHTQKIGHSPTQKNDAQDEGRTPELIRWSIQEIRRIANRMAQRQIQETQIIAWSIWRRTHQAAARLAHMRLKLQP